MFSGRGVKLGPAGQICPAVSLYLAHEADPESQLALLARRCYTAHVLLVVWLVSQDGTFIARHYLDELEPCNFYLHCINFDELHVCNIFPF